jgi:hypothetical protein
VLPQDAGFLYETGIRFDGKNLPIEGTNETLGTLHFDDATGATLQIGWWFVAPRLQLHQVFVARRPRQRQQRWNPIHLRFRRTQILTVGLRGLRPHRTGVCCLNPSIGKAVITNVCSAFIPLQANASAQQLLAPICDHRPAPFSSRLELQRYSLPRVVSLDLQRHAVSWARRRDESLKIWQMIDHSRSEGSDHVTRASPFESNLCPGAAARE